MQAYILLTCNTGSESDLIAELKKFPEITEINGIWGKYDIFLKVCTNDPHGVDQIVAKIRTMRDVTGSYTMQVLYGQGGSIDE